ncbi:unnamed protein product [Allacma fusca]|uniref:Uncharacterized protein n=1 Tax=Allacma fusca TaxID=39272 RepID=A0A8J2K745_9HEXA|nr:unnamed protein product [Allacma fusca]
MRYFLLFIGLALVQGSAIPSTESEKGHLKGTVSGDKTTVELVSRDTPAAVIETILLELPALVVKRPLKLKEKEGDSESDSLRAEFVSQGLGGQSVLEVGPYGNYQQVSQGLNGQSILTGYRTLLVKDKLTTSNVNQKTLNKSGPELRWGVSQGLGGQGISTPGFGYGDRLVSQGPGGQVVSGPGYGYGNRLVSQGASGQNVYGPSYRTVLVKEKPLEQKGAVNSEEELRYGLVSQGPGGQTISGPGPYGYGGFVSQGPGGQVISPGYGYGGLVSQGASGQNIYRPTYRTVLVEDKPLEQTGVDKELRYGLVNQGPGGQNILSGGPSPYGYPNYVSQGPQGQSIYSPYGYGYPSGVVNQGPGGQSVYGPYGGYVGQSGQGQSIGSSLYRLLVKEKPVSVETKKQERQLIQTYGPYGGASLTTQGPGGQYIATGYPAGGGAFVGQNSGGQGISVYRTLLKDKTSVLDALNVDTGSLKGEKNTARYFVNQGQSGQTIGGGYGYPSYVNQGGQGQSVLGYRSEPAEDTEENRAFIIPEGLAFETVPVAVVF